MQGRATTVFGRIDQYLLPYYEKDLADGVYTREEADALLAFFLMKPNEICGLGSYNHKVKPIPSVASKQYLTLGGCDVNGVSQANALSFAFLRAEEISNMPEPVVVARFDPQADPVFAAQVYRTMSVVTDKMHAYNDRLIYNALKRRGLPDEIAADFTFSGCCNVEVHHRTIRNEWYFPTPGGNLGTHHEFIRIRGTQHLFFKKLAMIECCVPLITSPNHASGQQNRVICLIN